MTIAGFPPVRLRIVRITDVSPLTPWLEICTLVMAKHDGAHSTRMVLRFTLTYWREISEKADGPEIWRGRIVRIPDPGGRDGDLAQSKRTAGFHSLDEIPSAIRRLLDDKPEPVRRCAHDGC